MENFFKHDIKREIVDDYLDLSNGSNGTEAIVEEDDIKQIYSNNNANKFFSFGK